MKQDIYMAHMLIVQLNKFRFLTHAFQDPPLCSSTDIHSLITVHRLGEGIDRRMNIERDLRSMPLQCNWPPPRLLYLLS